ncbi:hypothetical protein NR798_12660 [Archangium gephyra]|uniref:hypothetical protein n=1 Tax=Archangium gephyra TaxID=48 RepID=UPI0035D43B32
MRPVPSLLRASAALFLLWSCTAGAEAWRGATPGTSSLEEILRDFGKPTRRSTQNGEPVLTYALKAAPKGTRNVRFSFAPDNGPLQRIDVVPKPPPTRAAIEKTYGPACTEASGPEVPCYEVRLTPGSQFYFHYRSLGVEVFFQQRRVQSLTFRAPPSPGRASEDTPALASAEPAPTAAEPAVEEPAPAPAVAEPAPTAAEPAPASAPASVSLEMAPPTIEDAAPAEPAVGPATTPTAVTQGMDIPQQVPILDAEAWRTETSPQPHNILSLGGFYYQRAELSGARGADSLSLQPMLPSLVDVYLDIKPSDTLRGFVRGRLAYDALDPVLSSPQVLLDQFWFQFSLAHRVFFSVGRQQIKWGSSQVWNPTDFLQSPNPQPLDAFDLRTGVDMLKVNIPWEAMASNLWFVATADLSGPAEQRLRYGGAVRAEVTLGTSEVAASAYFKQGRRPRYGLDWSMGLGAFDLNAELALVRDSNVGLWQRTEEGFSRRSLGGPQLLASGGMKSTFRLGDVIQTTLRLEGFYNPLGYDDRAMLTWLRSKGDYRALFYGRYYGLVRATFARRSQHEPTLNLTGLMNVSDPSYLARVDFGMQVLRDVYFVTFVEMPFGARGSEFQFVPDPTVADLPATNVGVVRTGMSVRIRM